MVFKLFFFLAVHLRFLSCGRCCLPKGHGNVWESFRGLPVTTAPLIATG